MSEQGKLSWSEIRNIHPELPLIELGWHQHHNGGGWVEDTAFVAVKCCVGPQAIVRGFAQVTCWACISDQAVVCGLAKVSGRVSISSHAIIRERAWVRGNAKVCDHAVVAGRADVTGYVVICENAFVGGRAQLLGWERIQNGDCVTANTKSVSVRVSIRPVWTGPVKHADALRNPKRRSRDEW